MRSQSIDHNIDSNIILLVYSRYEQTEETSRTKVYVVKPSDIVADDKNESPSTSVQEVFNHKRQIETPSCYNASPKSASTLLSLTIDCKNPATPTGLTTTVENTGRNYGVDVYRYLASKNLQQVSTERSKFTTSSTASKQDEYFLPSWEGVKLSVGRSLTPSTTCQYGGKPVRKEIDFLIYNDIASISSKSVEKPNPSSILVKTPVASTSSSLLNAYSNFYEERPKAIDQQYRLESKLNTEFLHKKADFSASSHQSSFDPSRQPSKLLEEYIQGSNSRYFMQASALLGSRGLPTSAETATSSDDDDCNLFAHHQRSNPKPLQYGASNRTVTAKSSNSSWLKKHEETDSDSSSGWSMICNVGGFKSKS